MRRSISFGTAILALSLAAVLAGCGQVIDRVPTELGGLPSGAPQRSSAPPPYPAIHDVPQARSGPATALTDEQQLKLEKELAADRKRQEMLKDPTVKQRGDAATAAMENVRATVKKKPSPPNDQ